jgi:4-amino-4-deoxy-L-arabinose transferase-like glycosyltransferase
VTDLAVAAVGAEARERSWPRLLGVNPLFAILLGAALARLGLWLWFGDRPVHIWDEQVYNALAVNLARDGDYAIHRGIPSSERPPLYPFAVAGIYSLFGLESFAAVRAVQAIVGLVTVLLVWRLGSQLYGRRVGLWAAAWYALYPSLLAFNNLLLTETLFVLLLCIACLLILEACRRNSVAYVLAAGVTFGLTALTRSSFWLFPAVLGIFLLATWRGGTGRRLGAAAVLVVAAAVVIAPWAVRNTALEQTPMLIDSAGGRNVMFGNFESTPLYRSWDAVDLPTEQHWFTLLAAKYPQARAATQGGIDRLALRYAIEFILEHPGLTLHRDAIKFFQFWGLERELIAGAARGYFGDVPAAAVVVLGAVVFGAYATTILAAMFGLVMAPPADWRAHTLLLLAIAFLCLIHTLTFGHSRYHLPLIPLLLPYAASALTQAGAIWRRRSQRKFLVASAMSGALILSWLWDVAVVDGERFLQMLESLA